MMKNALVTGACGGLGRCLCEELLRRGYRVFGWNNTRESCADALRERFDGRFVFSAVDVGSYPAVEQAAREMAEMTAGLDMIVNAAGILPPNSARQLPEFDIDDSLDVYNINSLGPLRVVKATLPLLRNGGDKLIVQISSEAGSMTAHMPHYIHRYDYCMSKAALNIQSIILQRYLQDDGIRVYLIHPGWMRTEMGGENAPLSPAQSAGSILSLFDGGKRPAAMYMDYDGAQRPW